MRTCQILKSLGDLHKVVAHKAVNDKLSGLSKISSIFVCNYKHEKMFILVQIIDYRIANELSRRVLTLLKGLIR